MRKPLFTLILASALTGCAIGPDYQRPSTSFPDRYQNVKIDLPESVQHIEPRWWTVFNDDVLSNMIDYALVRNKDLAVATAQMDIAAAQAHLARTALLPQFSVSANGGRAQLSELSNIGTLADVYTAGVGVSWELDIWGKLRRSTESARAKFLAAQYNKDAVELSLASQVASTYFQMRALEASYQLSEETRKAREEAYDIQNKRFKEGYQSQLEVEQARSELAIAGLTAEQQAIALKTTQTALSVLLGQTPQEFLTEYAKSKNLESLVSTAPHAIPEGLPSDLLVRRPDVAAAEQQLVSANAQIGVARAAYFPSIGLTGDLGSQSIRLTDLFTGPAATWSFVGNLAAPLFNFGATRDNVRVANASQRVALANYQKAIQVAFKDTLDSLRTLNSTRKQIELERDQVLATETALHLVNLRYENGYSSYLEVLDTQRNYFSARLALIDIELSRLNAVINVYKSLGGGWQVR